jgi:ABC-type transport system substrate-binding protein
VRYRLFYALMALILLTVPWCGCEDGVESPGPLELRGEDTLALYGVSPTTLDPALAREGDSLEYIVEVFSGLVRFNPDLMLEPDLAESWERSGDGRVYTFYLRDGLRFHDGRKVTAHDFKYSLERACDPELGSQTAETYLGDIVGVKDKLAGAADSIEGVTVLSNRLLQITIDGRKEYFLSKLAHPVAFVVDKDNVESGVDWWMQPNGTGPFKLREWQDDVLIVLERNDLHYEADEIELKEVSYALWAGVPMMLYESGEIDVADVSLGDLERVLDPSNPLNKELSVTLGFGLSYVGFNTAEPPFDEVQVRRAFCYAIDKDKIVDLLYKGAVREADGILPPDMPGYNQYLHGLDFDVEKARDAIRESSYGNTSALPPMALTSSGRGYVSGLEGALVDMWSRNLGVEVEVKLWEPEIYPYVIMEEKDELFTMGWLADYPDPQNFLEVLFRTGTRDNFGEYSNAQVDAWLEEAGVEPDFTARMMKYGLAERAIVEEAACLPLFHDVSYTLVKPYVKDLPLTPMWIPRLKYVSIEPH